MNIYLMYLIIILLTLSLFILIKDKNKALKITGLITILSSFLLIILILIVKITIKNTVTSINLSTITNYLFNKFIYTSIILLLLGTIEILLSKYLNSKKIIYKLKRLQNELVK